MEKICAAQGMASLLKMLLAPPFLKLNMGFLLNMKIDKKITAFFFFLRFSLEHFSECLLGQSHAVFDWDHPQAKAEGP